MNNDLLYCAELVRNSQFEGIVKQLMALQNHIDTLKKQLKTKIEDQEYELVDY